MGIRPWFFCCRGNRSTASSSERAWCCSTSFTTRRASASASARLAAAGNDVSERTWQFRDIQWVRAKGSRTFNAVGPVLVAGLDYGNLQIEGQGGDDSVRLGTGTLADAFVGDHIASADDGRLENILGHVAFDGADR